MYMTEAQPQELSKISTQQLTNTALNVTEKKNQEPILGKP